MTREISIRRLFGRQVRDVCIYHNFHSITNCVCNLGSAVNRVGAIRPFNIALWFSWLCHLAAEEATLKESSQPQATKTWMNYKDSFEFHHHFPANELEASLGVIPHPLSICSDHFMDTHWH